MDAPAPPTQTQTRTQAHPPPASLRRCPECGGSAGGPVFPRRWRRARWIALLGVLLLWGLWVGLSLLRTPGPATATLTTPNDPHLYPVNAVDQWLDEAQRGQGGPDFYVRNVFVAGYPPWIPVPRDAPTEVALVANSVTRNTTPWVASSLRVEDLIDGGMGDAEFAKRARQELLGAFGEGWDTPAQENIAWRVRVEGSDAIEIRTFPASVGVARTLPFAWQGERWVGLTRVDLDWPAEPIWLRPTPARRHDGWWFRWPDDAVPGRWWTLDISVGITLRVAGVLLAALIGAWLRAPPIWKRRARKRRARRGCCLDCGYDLRLPGESA